MRRTVVAAWAVGVLGACEPEMAVEEDVPSASDGGADAPTTDVPGLDAPGADVPELDAGALDAGADAGDFEGHIVRMANMYMTSRTVELCLFADGIESPPLRLMEELGRPGGLARLEVSARFAFTPTRASVPVRVVDVADTDCATPIFSTTITGSRNRVVFVLSQLSLAPADDTLMAPSATDQWRHLLHDGASGVLAMTPDGEGAVFRPSYLYAPIAASGRITYVNDGGTGTVLLDRGFTPQPGGLITSFTLAPTSDEISFVLCDDRAAPVGGLTVCGDTVRP